MAKLSKPFQENVPVIRDYLKNLPRGAAITLEEIYLGVKDNLPKPCAKATFIESFGAAFAAKCFVGLIVKHKGKFYCSARRPPKAAKVHKVLTGVERVEKVKAQLMLLQEVIMEKSKLDLLIEKYGTREMSVVFRRIAANVHLSPHMAKEAAEMTTMLEEALKEYALKAHVYNDK